MADAPDGYVSRADLDTLIGAIEILRMYSRGRAAVVRRSYFDKLIIQPGFPPPLVVYPKPDSGRTVHIRLWLPGDVEAWMVRTIPGWDDLPPPPLD